MSARKPCPHCGHRNLERAIFCFQCGRPVDVRRPRTDQPKVPRRNQRILQTMWVADSQAADPPVLPSGGGTSLLAELQLEEPITCLACGTLNRPEEARCTTCGQPLLIPEARTGLRIRVSARTDVGQVRGNNEDSIGLWSANGMLLALVADGMGGAAAGEEASRLAVEAVQADFVGEGRAIQGLEATGSDPILNRLAAALRAANLALIERVNQESQLRGMGTTATLVLVAGGRLFAAHIGDSRAYLVDGRQGWINQITADHSFVEALLSAGHITEEQAAEHPMKNVLYRALGQSAETIADVYDRYLKAGDAIVLCSDGLTRHVKPVEIAEAVLAEETRGEATRRLVALANERGGEDNVSVVVIRLEGGIDETVELLQAADTLLRNTNDATGILDDQVVDESSAKAARLLTSSELHREVLHALGFSTQEIREWIDARKSESSHDATESGQPPVSDAGR